MPLAINRKEEVSFSDRVAKLNSIIVNNGSGNLNYFLILFTFLALFSGDMSIILAIFLVLYFLDRWDIKKYISKAGVQEVNVSVNKPENNS